MQPLHRLTQQGRLGRSGWALCRAVAVGLMLAGSGVAGAAGDASRFSDEPGPYLGDDELPKLTPPIVELGGKFLGPGNIPHGVLLPGGAVWQPQFWVYGTFRSALQSFDNDLGTGRSELVSRLDLFGNLQLSGSERVLIGIRPLNDGAQFTGWQYDPDRQDPFEDHTNADITTLFFEGDFGELFPALDPTDRHDLDIGFSVGRQQITFQDGFLINDRLDAIGLTRNNLRFPSMDWLNNLRITVLYAWDEIDRDDNAPDDGARLYALFTQWDTVFGNQFSTTVDLDLALVDGSQGRGDLIAGGISAVQRLGLVNTTFRFLFSNDIGSDGTGLASSDDGQLFFTEWSITPYHTHNLLYANAFYGQDNFSSAARDPLAGGPLGRTGITFAARGIGAFPAPLGNRTDDAWGVALGYQMFWNRNRTQLIVETGRRGQHTVSDNDASAISFRLQQAVGRRVLLQFGGFLGAADTGPDQQGLRAELVVKL